MGWSVARRPAVRSEPRQRVSGTDIALAAGRAHCLVALGAGDAKVVSTRPEDSGSLRPGSGGRRGRGVDDPAATAAADDPAVVADEATHIRPSHTDDTGPQRRERRW